MCRRHYDIFGSTCPFYCAHAALFLPAIASRVCVYGVCLEVSRACSLQCSSCWVAARKLCVVRGVTPAQKCVAYLSRCQACASTIDPDRCFHIVREESERYLQPTSIQQTWDDTEAPLQLLLLLDANPLPRTPAARRIFDSFHCRLCLGTYAGLPLEQHLAEQHGLAFREYRRLVLRRTLSAWLEPNSHTPPAPGHWQSPSCFQSGTARREL